MWIGGDVDKMPQVNNSTNDRMMRGMAIAEKKTIAENADGSFAVPSQTVDEIVYHVQIVDNVWACNCPDHISRKVECKHIHATRFWIASRTKLQAKPKPKVFADDALQMSMRFYPRREIRSRERQADFQVPRL